MKWILAGVGVFAFVCALLYVVTFNQGTTQLDLAPNLIITFPLGGLIVATFLAGGAVVSTAMLLQAARRAIGNWRQTRQRRKRERIDTWEERGEQLMWQGDARHARPLLEKAWRKRPDSTYAVLHLAASYRATGEIGRERQFLIEATAKTHHTNPEVLLALADAHATEGNQAASIEVLERVRALHPRAPRILSVIRDAYAAAGRWHDAVAPQEGLIAELRDPMRAAAEQHRLVVLRYQAALQIEDPAARAAALEALADRKTPEVPVAVSLGDSLGALGRLDEAVAVWERGLRVKPRSVFVQRLAGVATEPKHRDRLQTILTKLRADLVQPDGLALMNAHLHLTGGKIAEAEKALVSLRNPDSAPSFIHFLRGQIFKQHGQLDRAFEELVRAQPGPWTYRCRACGHAAGDCPGRCSACGGWDSHRAAVEIGAD